MNASTPQKLASAAELQDFVRACPAVHVLGKGSKTALHRPANGAAMADLSALSGIYEYQPSEYTITVGAGTPVQDVAAALAEAGQYLPFDPLMPASATIGGTVAANLSGSRRFRYGGVRDFILGAKVVDGAGRAYRVGSKVVKNSAGFDLSKFLVGSLGKYAIMTELTFKVFPDAPCFHSLQLHYADLPAALAAIHFVNQSVFELDALDLLPANGEWALLARLGGSEATLPSRAKRFTEDHARRDIRPGSPPARGQAGALGSACRAARSMLGQSGAFAQARRPQLDAMLGDCPRRYSVGGNVAWLATDDAARLDATLRGLRLRGLCLLGQADAPVIGLPLENELSARVKQVLDPQGKLV